MITGCPDCPHQGDGNSQAGLQAHINRVPGPTVVDAALALAADRPSVTDNARAEAWRRFPNGIDVETGEPVDDYGYPETAREAFIGGAEWAAGRAETTTAAVRAECGCDLSVGPNAVHIVDGHPDPRPSATDNTRAAEQRSEYTVQETAAYFARKVQRVSDRIRSTDYQRSVSDIVGLDSIQGFLDRVARDDLDMFAAGRAETTAEDIQALDARWFERWETEQPLADKYAGYYQGRVSAVTQCREELRGLLAMARAHPTETTTATVEDAVEVAYRMAYDVMRYHPGIWHNSLRAAVEALADAGLLARPLPDRDEIAQALDRKGAFCGECGGEPGEFFDSCAVCQRILLGYADAVLGLLRGGGDDR